MKKIIIFYAFVFCTVFTTFAATDITTSTVSGHWTLTGSPYNIFNNIRIDTTALLEIDPGVQVIFHGPYSLHVIGKLRALGSPTEHISFTISDTTGWSTDTVNSAGGWHGIQFLDYLSISPDNSLMNYCDLSYTKFSDSAYYSDQDGMYTLQLRRAMTLKNCRFFNNKSKAHFALFDIFGYRPNLIQRFDSCIFDRNVTNGLNIHAWNNDGKVVFRNCRISDNSGRWILLGENVKLDVEFCDIFNNQTNEGVISAFSWASYYNVINITGNKIHHNVTVTTAALALGPGKVTVENNLICNNEHTVYTHCPWVEGGGGIRCIYNDTSVPTRFIIRNNVIANNSSAANGAGINISGGNAIISNNQIINNSSPEGPGIYFFDEGGAGAPTIVKNNIFFGNSTDSLHSGNIGGYIAHSIVYEHNWTDYPFYVDVSWWLLPVIADSTANIIGTDPGLIDPTISASVTENALTANFGIISGSPCVDQGDTVGVFPAAYDYVYNYRIYSSAIDIGAYELGGIPYPLLVTPASINNESKFCVYPNPAAKILFVSLGESKGKIIMVDALGKQVLEMTVANKTSSLDISALPRGIYFAAWQHDSKQDIQKVIVE